MLKQRQLKKYQQWHDNIDDADNLGHFQRFGSFLTGSDDLEKRKVLARLIPDVKKWCKRKAYRIEGWQYQMRSPTPELAALGGQACLSLEVYVSPKKFKG